MATKENLQNAFSGESQANRKYLAFAKKAEADAFPNVAKVFRAAAEAETVHAIAHLKVMKGIKSTAENLQEAIKGESFEYKVMYPGYVDEARAEGDKAALASFANAMAVEQVHYNLYLDALQSVQEGRDIGERTIFVCSVCGNTVLGQPPDTCPVCGSPKKKFFEAE
jgi:rubrerythrin